MKLRSITLENVRRFSDPVHIGPIGDGVTLLCEPNEAGKSTLFDALHALFFLRHSSKAAEAKALRPHSGGTVAVECALEHEGAAWRIRKEWFTGASAKVWRDGTLAHQGDAAEDWLGSLVAGDAGGPGGLLWVRQGRVSLKAPERKDEAEELEKRRDLLTAVSGALEQVTGGERMDRARDRVDADLGKLQTSTGRAKTGGRWAEAEALVLDLQEQKDGLARVVDLLRSDLDARRRLQSDLAELEDAEANEKRRADAAQAQTDLRAAEQLATELATARMQAKLARERCVGAQSEAARLAGLRLDHDEAVKAQAMAQDQRAAAASHAQQANASYLTAKDNHDKAKAKMAASENLLRQITRFETAQRATADRARLVDQIKQAQAAEDMRLKQAAIAAKGPSAKTVARIDGLARDLAAKRAVRDAGAPRISARYDAGAPRVTLAGVPLEEGATHVLAHDVAVDMPGIGQLRVETADHEAGLALEAAEDALHAALLAGQWADMATLELAAVACAEATRAADLAAQKRDTMAPNGIDALQVELAALGEAVADDGADLPAREDAEQAHLTASETAAQALADLEKAREKKQAAEVAAAKAETLEEGAQQRLDKAVAQTAALPAADPKAEAARLAQLEEDALSAEETYRKRAAETPDLETLRARHARLVAVLASSANDATRIKAEIGKLEGRIETRGEEGVEEALEDVRGRLEHAQSVLARVVFEKDVLLRLRGALEAAQKAARETYFAPVAEELRPLLADLWGEAELAWSDDTLLPAGLVRKGTQEAIDVLSGGTQEQIAFLVRLAFARLLAKSGRHAPLILDDALVYSDDDRIEKMFDALHTAAHDLQIIVLSCRQRAFRNLGVPSLSFQKQDGM